MDAGAFQAVIFAPRCGTMRCQGADLALKAAETSGFALFWIKA
jgi:hypothetical protein